MLFRAAKGYYEQIPSGCYKIASHKTDKNFSVVYKLQPQDSGFDVVMQAWDAPHTRFDYYIIAGKVSPA